MSRAHHPENLRTVAVVRGNHVVRLHAIRVRARIIHLEAAVPSRPVVGGGGAIGHDARGPAGQTVVTDGDPHHPVLGEGQAVADHAQAQHAAGRHRPALISRTQLGPIAVDPLEQHQLRGARVPVVDTRIQVLTAILGPHYGTHPLGPAQLRRGHRHLGVLVVAIHLAGANITRIPAPIRPDHHLRRNGHPGVGHVSPSRPQTTIRPVEIIGA